MTPQQEAAYIQNMRGNPVGSAVLKADIMKTIRSIKADAELQVLMGDAADRLIYHSGRLLYAVCCAAVQCKVPMDSPEIRIMRGMSNALGELADRRDKLEQHRPSIQSGLAAMERLMPKLNAWALGLGLLECDEAIKKQGIGVRDIDAMLGAVH